MDKFVPNLFHNEYIREIFEITHLKYIISDLEQCIVVVTSQQNRILPYEIFPLFPM